MGGRAGDERIEGGRGRGGEERDGKIELPKEVLGGIRR